MKRDEAGGRNSMSPLPRSCSAPLPSRIVRESIFDAHAERDARRQVRLDQAGDDVHRRPLRREDQVDADGARHLREARDRLFDLVARHHHQVGELVDDDDDEGQRLQLLAVLGRLSLGERRADVAVVLLDVADAFGRERLVALFHFADRPAQRVRRLLRDRRRPASSGAGCLRTSRARDASDRS